MSSPQPLWTIAEERDKARKAAAARAKAEAARLAEQKRVQALRAANLRPDGKTVLSPCPGEVVETPWRKKPNNSTYWQTRGYHTGDDYPGEFGDACVAVLDGTWYHLQDAVLGNVGLLFADDGDTYWYCHMGSRIPNGTRVKKNQKVGVVSDTGTGANGPHLHFEKRNGHTRSWKGIDLKPVWY